MCQCVGHVPFVYPHWQLAMLFFYFPVRSASALAKAKTQWTHRPVTADQHRHPMYMQTCTRERICVCVCVVSDAISRKNTQQNGNIYLKKKIDMHMVIGDTCLY